jgi:hypothetical protein
LGGETQVGKFVTIYPPTGEEAAAAAERLLLATTALSGPRVSWDHQIPGSEVLSYRYGVFGNSRPIRTLLGTYELPLLRPDGTTELDSRESFVAPGWETDPFLSHGATHRGGRMAEIVSMLQPNYHVVTLFQTPGRVSSSWHLIWTIYSAVL